MDIKTIVIKNGEIIQEDDNNIKLTDEYIELVPEGMLLNYLKLEVNFASSKHGYTSFVKINEQVCGVYPQVAPLIINSEDDINVHSLKINSEVMDGFITMLIYNKPYLK